MKVNWKELICRVFAAIFIGLFLGILSGYILIIYYIKF